MGQSPSTGCSVVRAIASHQRCGKSCGQDQELPARAKERVKLEQALPWERGTAEWVLTCSQGGGQPDWGQPVAHKGNILQLPALAPI